mgnify:CR=1 FL=1
MAKAKKAKKTAAKKKASKPKAAAKLAESAEQKAARLPSANVVKSLANVLTNGQSKIDDIAGSNSSAMREAVDKRGVHQRAFKAALAFYKRARKDPASFAIEIQHFDHYLECLGVDDMIAKEPTLPIDVDGQAKASAAGAVKEAAKPVAAKATRSNGEAKDTSVTLDDGTKLNPKFTDPAAEQHVAEQSKALN